MGHATHLAGSFEPFEQTTVKRNQARTASSLDEKCRKVLDLMVAQLRQDPMTIGPLAVVQKRSNRSIERALLKLREHGVIQRIGPDKGGCGVFLMRVQ